MNAGDHLHRFLTWVSCLLQGSTSVLLTFRNASCQEYCILRGFVIVTQGYHYSHQSILYYAVGPRKAGVVSLDQMRHVSRRIYVGKKPYEAMNWACQQNLSKIKLIKFSGTLRYKRASPTPVRRSDLALINKEKTLSSSGFCRCNRLERKHLKNKPIDNYLNLARELKKLKVTVILITVGALGKVTRGLVKRMGELEIRRSLKTIQNTALLRSSPIDGRVLEIVGDLLPLRLQWITTY